jgi:hypothetical protein
MPFGQSTGQGFVNPGIVVANTVIVEGPKGAILIYSPAPGAGNLIGSWSGATTTQTDKYGNTYPPGLQISNGLLTILDPGKIEFKSGSTVTGSIQSDNVNSLVVINAPNDLLIANGDLLLDGRRVYYSANGFNPQPWQLLTGLNFVNGWGGTFKWRNGAENEIKFQCGLTVGTTTVDGTPIATVVGLAPAVAQRHTVYCNALRTGAIGAATEGAALQLETNGSITCWGVALAATVVSGVGYWPLDN